VGASAAVGAATTAGAAEAAAAIAVANGSKGTATRGTEGELPAALLAAIREEVEADVERAGLTFGELEFDDSVAADEVDEGDGNCDGSPLRDANCAA
jgi:hypothetical protein